MFERENALRILTDEQEEIVHEQAMRILEEIGTDVLHDQARTLLSEAGLKVDGDRVYWDRGFVMDQVAKVPRSFRMRARNPERSVTVGEGGTPLWMNVGGPPFASDLDEGRRSGRIQDHDTFIKLTQATDVLNCAQTGAAEATDLQMEVRHMDMEYSTIRYSDKPYTTYGTSGPRARDGIRMAEIVHGGLVGLLIASERMGDDAQRQHGRCRRPLPVTLHQARQQTRMRLPVHLGRDDIAPRLLVVRRRRPPCRLEETPQLLRLDRPIVKGAWAPTSTQ